MPEPDQPHAVVPLSELTAIGRHPTLSTVERMNPWQLTRQLNVLVRNWINVLDPAEYQIDGDQAVHRSATIEPTAQLKGPLIIGADCFVANGSLLRDGIFLDGNTIVGHCVELKSTVMLSGSKVAHLSFVGDSVLGCGVNIEAGAMLANYRNEWQDKTILINWRGQTLPTDCDKFGSVLGDDARVGAGAVLAPGTIVGQREVVRRGCILDQIIGR